MISGKIILNFNNAKILKTDEPYKAHVGLKNCQKPSF
jgi:hypothetical protein